MVRAAIRWLTLCGFTALLAQRAQAKSVYPNTWAGGEVDGEIGTLTFIGSCFARTAEVSGSIPAWPGFSDLSSYGGGGGGGFFLACEDFGRMFGYSLLTCAYFFFIFIYFFFVCVEISSRKLITRFTPGSVHSGSASWDDRGRVFPEEFLVSLFPDSFPHYAWTAA